jgi:hypothetical protein
MQMVQRHMIYSHKRKKTVVTIRTLAITLLEYKTGTIKWLLTQIALILLHHIWVAVLPHPSPCCPCLRWASTAYLYPSQAGWAQLLAPPPRPTPFPSGSWQQPVSMSGTLPNLKAVFNPGKALLHGVLSKLNPAVWTPRFYNRDGLKGAIFVIWLWDITITFLSYRNCLNGIIRKGPKARGLQFHVS